MRHLQGPPDGNCRNRGHAQSKASTHGPCPPRDPATQASPAQVILPAKRREDLFDVPLRTFDTSATGRSRPARDILSEMLSQFK